MQPNEDVPTRSRQNDVDNSEEEEAGHTNVHNATFGSKLDRFRHGEDTKVEDIADDKPRLRPSRKRPLEPVDDDEPLASSQSPAKQFRQSSRYAPPSKYAHLNKLHDVIEPGLIAVFVGFNPGVRTATSGHAYAHPSNMFWKLLQSSGCTDTRLRPEQDVDLPRLCSLGNTNIVDRPSKDAAELSKAEMAAGTPILEEKIRKFRPEAVCIVGKGIWEAIWRWRYKREIKKPEFYYGWQDDKERIGKTSDWEGARVFVATATSGLSASTKPAEKAEIWLPFGQWVKTRRTERVAEASARVDDAG